MLCSGSKLEPICFRAGSKLEPRTQRPALSSDIKARSSEKTVLWYRSFLSVLLIFQSAMTITPLSKGIIYPFDDNSRRSSSLQPTPRAIFLGDETKPSSSPCIPKWKYNACALTDISRNLSVSVTESENIRFSAIRSPPHNLCLSCEIGQCRFCGACDVCNFCCSMTHRPCELLHIFHAFRQKISILII